MGSDGSLSKSRKNEGEGVHLWGVKRTGQEDTRIGFSPVSECL